REHRSARLRAQPRARIPNVPAPRRSGSRGGRVRRLSRFAERPFRALVGGTRAAKRRRRLAEQPFLAELRERLLRLRQAVEAHAAKNLWRLRELDVAIVDDLDVVPSGVEEIEATTRL